MKLETKSLATLAALTTAFSLMAASPNGAGVKHSTTTQFALRPIPASAVHHGQRPPRIRNKNGTSSNWSGYAVFPLAATSSSVVRNGNGKGKGNKPGPTSTPTFTDVTGSWVVPTLNRTYSADPSYSSTWVGLDGYSDSTVEQIGTDQDWSSGSPQYFAWFEMYPKWAYEIVGFPVNPGDIISAEVQYTSKGAFTLTIVNVTEGVSFSTKQRASSAQRLSAEWIEEAPWSGGVLPLADFGSVGFFDCYAIMDGHNGPINDTAWQYDPITMATSADTDKAVPSGLSHGGTSFSVTWYSE